jgi:hypothetical protein
MKKYLFYGVIINALLQIYGCSNVKNNYELIIYEDINSFSKQKIELTKIETEEYLMAPRRIWMQDSVLILNDNGYSENGFLRFYTNSGKFITKFGRIGNGPDEYLNPRFTKIKDSIIIIATNKKYTSLSLKNIENDTSFFVNTIVLKDETLYTSNYFFPINDTLIIVNTTSEYQFFIYNKESNIKRQINNYPDEHGKNVSGFCLNTTVYDAFYNVNPSKEHILVAYKYYSAIDIIDVINFSTRRIKFENKSPNTYRIIDPQNVKFENPLIQYTFSYCTDTYFYLLYQNATREDLKQNKNKSEIHVFDWKGNIIKRYALNQPIYNFAVSDNDDYLYALGLDEKLDPQLYVAKTPVN